MVEYGPSSIVLNTDPAWLSSRAAALRIGRDIRGGLMCNLGGAGLDAISAALLRNMTGWCALHVGDVVEVRVRVMRTSSTDLFGLRLRLGRIQSSSAAAMECFSRNISDWGGGHMNWSHFTLALATMKESAVGITIDGSKSRVRLRESGMLRSDDLSRRGRDCIEAAFACDPNLIDATFDRERFLASCGDIVPMPIVHPRA